MDYVKALEENSPQALEEATARCRAIEDEIDAARADGTEPSEDLLHEALDLQEHIYAFRVRHELCE